MSTEAGKGFEVEVSTRMRAEMQGVSKMLIPRLEEISKVLKDSAVEGMHLYITSDGYVSARFTDCKWELKKMSNSEDYELAIGWSEKIEKGGAENGK